MKKSLLAAFVWVGCMVGINPSCAFTDAEIQAAVKDMQAHGATAQDIAAAANAYGVSASQMDSALGLDPWTANSHMNPPDKPAPSYTPPYFEPPLPSTPPPQPTTDTITSLNGNGATIQEWVDWMQKQAAAGKTNEQITKEAVDAWFTLDQITKVANSIPWVKIDVAQVQKFLKEDVAVNSQGTTITVQQWADWIKRQLDSGITPEMTASLAMQAWFDADTIAAAAKLMAKQDPKLSSMAENINTKAISDLVSSTWSLNGQQGIIGKDGTVKDDKGNVIGTLDTSNGIFTDTSGKVTDVFTTSKLTMNFQLPGGGTFKIKTDGGHGVEMARAGYDLAAVVAEYGAMSPEAQKAYDEYNYKTFQWQGWKGVFDPSYNYAGANQLPNGDWAFGCTNNPDFMWLVPDAKSRIVTYVKKTDPTCEGPKCNVTKTVCQDWSCKVDPTVTADPGCTGPVCITTTDPTCTDPAKCPVPPKCIPGVDCPDASCPPGKICKTECTNLVLCPTNTCPPGQMGTYPNCTTPVVTSPSGWGGCSSYISSWTPAWSACTINSNWTPGGTISCLQTNPWAPVSSACWVTVYTTTTSCTPDGACSDSTSASCDASSCPANAPQPAPETDTKTITMNLNNPVTAHNSAYANDYDSNSVIVNISGTTNQGREITGWGDNGIFKSFSDASHIPSNRIGGGWQALNFSDVPMGNIMGAGTNFTFQITSIKSRAPFVWNGNIGFQAGGTPMILNNVSYSFKKPFTGKIETSPDNGATWNGTTKLWTEMLYRLWLMQRSTLTWNGLSWYSLNDFSSAIMPYGDGLALQSKSIASPLTDTSGTRFKARINTSSDASSLNQNPGLQINLPIITYTLGGQTVKYHLSEQDAGNDMTPITTSGDEFLGVRVIGGIQWVGKSEFTGQKANISTIAASEMRAKIRQNAYTYTRNMKSGQIVNGVRYAVGDVTLSWEPNYETLVVKDGNVIIEGDLNTEGKKFWIVVMKDGYDINTGYSGKGNVYVTPSVKQINAIVYADGGFISADAFKNAYTADSALRSSVLQNQLFMNGSLFTRNTIGWAILKGGNYVLPGWSTLADTDQNFDKAMVYDLNYVRRWNVGCDKNGNGNCTDAGEYKQSFIIQYDSRIQTSPVKLFTVQ